MGLQANRGCPTASKLIDCITQREIGSEIMMPVFSIGHSTLSYEQFVSRLKSEKINAIADVRSSPFSRNFPQFNKDTLRFSLNSDKIAYVFLGKELGGRPKEPSLYTDGVANYEKMANSESFQEGIKRIELGAKKYRIALMCSERDPLDCHRCLLVGRALNERGTQVFHILNDTQTVDQVEIERQLLAIAGTKQDDMFASRADQIKNAYQKRARKVAFPEAIPSGSATAGQTL